MLYPKNVPNIERILRIGLGVVLAVVALSGSTFLGEPTALRTGLLLFTAAFVIVTGFVGWCPACAMVGRKIKQRNTTQS